MANKPVNHYFAALIGELKGHYMTFKWPLHGHLKRPFLHYYKLRHLAQFYTLFKNNNSEILVDLCGHATLAAAHFLFAYGLVNTDIDYCRWGNGGRRRGSGGCCCPASGGRYCPAHWVPDVPVAQPSGTPPPPPSPSPDQPTSRLIPILCSPMLGPQLYYPRSS
ncbi:hypothetical protein RND71_022969 [Anisodus tanguticus]|uniref:Uncharacterized protein n=1 Tax=Anisodus tanguticus TaxID=243964 RepID=A0AAE1RRS4_9SOLA|nr:hypothetical protein RND71_022969 [Anisodus tanguticus]